MADEASGGAAQEGQRSVFLSYSSKDRKLADSVHAILKDVCAQVWMAPSSLPPGASYAKGIIQGINEADIVFLLMTRNANASREVEREIERAAAKKKTIIGLRADNFTLTGALEYFLSNVQWVDLTIADESVWRDSVRQAAIDPESKPPPQPRAGIILFTATNMLLFAGLLSCLGALALPLLWPLAPSYVAGGVLIVGLGLMIGSWIRGRGGAGRSRIFSLRVGDVAMALTLAGAIAGVFYWMLLTPLVAALALLALYLSFRSKPEIFGKTLWRRGGVVAVLALLALGGSVTFAEVGLYQMLKPAGVVLVLVPNDECPASGTCGAVPRDLYFGVRDILSDVFRGTNVSVYPADKPTAKHYDDIISRLGDEPTARGSALRDAIVQYREVFHSVLTLEVNYQAAGVCGAAKPGVDFEVDLSDWREGRWPTRAFWKDTPTSANWRPFHATVDLDKGARSETLAIATDSMAAQLLIAAEHDQSRFGGAAQYKKAVARMIDIFLRRARVTAPPFDDIHREVSAAALAKLQAAQDTRATLAQELTALAAIVKAYEPRLERSEAVCQTEADTLATRLAPQAAPVEAAPAAPTPPPPSDGAG